MTELLDANVLVALTSPDHVHHGPARAWFERSGLFATCPLTQLALVRVLMQFAVPSAGAVSALGVIQTHPRHVFWPDDVPVDGDGMRAVIGHRQVTDSYLVMLARRHSGRVATFDGGLATVHPGFTVLVPTVAQG